MRSYSAEFYEHLGQSSMASAREIVPLVLDLIHVKRVIDVGCGTGDWLLAFMERGAEEVLGIDGEWVDPAILKIPPSCFLRHDLRSPLLLAESFDLVISLETAEHLPGEVAETFIESLTKLGPVVLFSGAIPFQGGVGHVNEQWPDYWAAHFRRHDYVAVDCLREQIWNNKKVSWWYAQNLMLFVENGYLQTCKLLQAYSRNSDETPLPLVHPSLYLDKVKQTHLRRLLRLKLFALKQAMKSLVTRR